MELKIIDSPSKELIAEIEAKIDDFNIKHWEVKERKPIAIEVRDHQKNLLAGATGRTFGYWLLIDNIWVSEHLRGKNIGSQLLSGLEKVAISRGCKFSLLDTLNFQAQHFYEKFGYKVQWIQENYPRDGAKFFMTKNLA
jgi:ribosomal protein S18 acetylase RimI-like enzyme